MVRIGHIMAREVVSLKWELNGRYNNGESVICLGSVVVQALHVLTQPGLLRPWDQRRIRQLQIRLAAGASRQTTKRLHCQPRDES